MSEIIGLDHENRALVISEEGDRDFWIFELREYAEEPFPIYRASRIHSPEAIARNLCAQLYSDVSSSWLGENEVGLCTLIVEAMKAVSTGSVLRESLPQEFQAAVQAKQWEEAWRLGTALFVLVTAEGEASVGLRTLFDLQTAAVNAEREAARELRRSALHTSNTIDLDQLVRAVDMRSDFLLRVHDYVAQVDFHPELEEGE